MASVLAAARAAERVTQGAARLLRADLMPVVVAILDSRFADARVIGYPEFVEQVSDDLEELRGAGFPLPRTAQDYIADWIAKGILIRRASTTAREETVELSREAIGALKFVVEAELPQSSVTSSRLTNVSSLLGSLARDSNPDASTRIEALREQAAEIEAEIARIESGDFEPLDDRLAQERLSEIMRLAGEVPGDFAKVADDLEALNSQLREQIINNDGSRGGVLDEVFAGVDLIEQSDSGRTFSAFHELLLDPVLSDRFDTAVDAVLSRPFTSEIPPTEAVFLRRFLTVLQRESTQVRSRLTDFSRSLRRFVQTQEYREHKRLAAALTRADGAAFEALRKHPPTAQLGRDLDLSSVQIASVGAWALKNPADQRTVDEVLAHETSALDLEELRALVRLTEIDFPELESAVADAVAELGSATVADVLERHPATQGLASIVGLYILAVEHASRAAGVEDWTWQSAAGLKRSVSADRYVFVSVPEHWSTHES